MKIILALTKPCSKVDRYEAVDSTGAVIKTDPPVGATYIDKKITKGAERISLTIAVEK